MWSAFGSIHLSRLSPLVHLTDTRKLTEVELSEGLVEIGNSSFSGSSFLDCGNSISKINIPNSLRRINDYAFCRSLSVLLFVFMMALKALEEAPSLVASSPHFRVSQPSSPWFPGECYPAVHPPFPSKFPKMWQRLKVKHSNLVFLYGMWPFLPMLSFGNYVVSIMLNGEMMSDLQRLFGNSIEIIIRELQLRFDGLPIHRIVYYQSYV
jgi:hypothetical protein